MAAKKVSDFKPINPRDPKMPQLKTSLDNTGSVWEDDLNSRSSVPPIDFSEPTFEVVVEKPKPEVKKTAKQLAEESTQVLYTQDDDMIAAKNSAMAWLKKRSSDVKVIDELDPTTYPEQEVLTGELQMPDPSSPDKFSGRKRDLYQAQRVVNDKKIQIRGMTDIVRTKIDEKDLKKIMQAFEQQIIKVTSTEVIFKVNKYGYEIYYNNADGRWWVSTLIFDEPFNPKKMLYVTMWVGNTFLGYGFNNLDDCISKAKDISVRGRTGNVMWKDYLISFNVQTNRIVAGDEAVPLTFTEYQKFVKWFTTNKIWIMVKREGTFDAEDLMIQTREQRKSGQEVNPLASIQAKLLEPPRKASYLAAYPVKDPKYKGKEWKDPKNKLYVIGFTYHE